MSNLLITGAVLRPNGFELGEGKYYENAKLLRLNLATGKIDELLSVSEGNDNFPAEYPNLEFTVGVAEEDKLWLTTDTEVRLYQYPEPTLLTTFSHPCFHNVHSVAVYRDRLYVTSTGLDMVVVLDKGTGEIVDQLNTEGKSLWHRFSPDKDYRKLHSTRPHDCHPNHIFWIDDEPWVTRCKQEDAVCLTDLSKRIDISGSDKVISVHDGHVEGDKVYFSSVDGCLIVADKRSFKVLETIELYKYEGFGGIRGWCRGLYIQDNLFYLGFSRLRKTKAKGKLAWLKNMSGVRQPSKFASILAFDMAQRKIVADYPVPAELIDAIYSILPEPTIAGMEVG